MYLVTASRGKGVNPTKINYSVKNVINYSKPHKQTIISLLRPLISDYKCACLLYLRQLPYFVVKTGCYLPLNAIKLEGKLTLCIVYIQKFNFRALYFGGGRASTLTQALS